MMVKCNLLVWFFVCHIANILDGIFTLYAVSKGVEELNPFMAYLLDFSPFAFLLIKLLLFAAAIDYVAKKRPNWLKPIGWMYILVIIWHVSFIFYI